MNLLLTQTLDVKVSDFGTGTPPIRADTRKKHDRRKESKRYPLVFLFGVCAKHFFKDVGGFYIGRCVNE